jgi:hypothetical protein
MQPETTRVEAFSDNILLPLNSMGNIPPSGLHRLISPVDHKIIFGNGLPKFKLL